MAANETAYAYAEQYRADAVAARDAAAAEVQSAFEEFVAGTTGGAVVFGIVAGAITAKAVAEQVALADEFLSLFLTFDTGFEFLPVGLDPARFVSQSRLEAAYQVSATRRSVTDRLDLAPARLSIAKVSESEIFNAGRRALTELLIRRSLPPQREEQPFVTPQQFFAEAAQAAREGRPRRTPAPRSRPRVTGWRRMTGPNPCDVCRALADGQLRDPGDFLKPGHPRCRCTALPVTSAGDLIKPPTAADLPKETTS